MSKQKRTIAIDFDGVIHTYHGYNHGLLQGPIPGAREAILKLQEKGFTTVIFSTRNKAMIEEWLAKHNFPVLEVTNVKRPFWLILDDRGVTFHGRWTDTLINSILSFEPYWIKDRKP